MGVNYNKNNKIIDSGKKKFEQTTEYLLKVNSIKNEIQSKYKPLIESEKNNFKKIFIWIKMKYEIRQGINKLSSIRNLHFTSSQ